MIKIEIGDVLLLPADKSEPYKWLAKKLGYKTWQFCKTILDLKYSCQELYIGGGYTLSQTFGGVHIVSYPLKHFTEFHIYRNPQFGEKERRAITELVMKYFNKQFDFISLVLNGIPEVLSLGIEPLERYLEKALQYDDPKRLTCSELVARIYQDVGFVIEPYAEFVTPDDIQDQLVRLL